MDIILHAHHADVPDMLRNDAEHAVRRIASRWNRVVDAIVRFVSDGPTRRVEIVLRSAHSRDLFVQADARAFRPALAVAVHRLQRQVASSRRSRRDLADGARDG
jgi:hypothetical protein